jgi:hypothetical protein
MSAPPPLPVRRSTFVTVLAWIFIGLSGFMAWIGVLQNLMMQLVFLPSMRQQMTSQPLPPDMPPQMLWVFGHFEWFFRVFLLLALVHLVAAIWLLLRRNWARLLFIGVMVFDCFYQIGTVALQWWVTGPMTQAMMRAPGMHGPQSADVAQVAQAAQTIEAMMSVMRIFSMLMALGFIMLFGWIVKRLCSPAIRHEFQSPLASSTGNPA